MERLHFGARARRRAKLKRIAVWAAITSTIGLALGIPGTDAGFDIVMGLTGQLNGGPGGTVQRGAGIEASESGASGLEFRRSFFETRPTPTPSPTEATAQVAVVPAAPAGSIADVIYGAAAEFGLGGDYLLSVAECESGLDPNAYNAAGYHGLFQFDQTTWAAYGYGSIYDPVAQARTAARLLAAGQSSRWPNCA